MTDAKSDDSYARDLLIHAECLIRYLRISGGSSAELQATYSALKAADPTAADRSRLLIDLETKVVELQQTILPETRAAISGGWPRANTRWNRTKDKFVSGLLIVLAMVLVLATGKLTYIQNTGNNLIGELESLSSPDTLKTYSRLIRGMAQAWYQADKALPPAETDQKTANAESDLRQVGAYWGAVSVPPAGGDPVPATVTPDDAAAKTAAAFDTYTLPAQFDLARNVYFDNEADLKSIVDRYSAAMEGQRTIYGQFNTTCVPAAPDAQSESYLNGVNTGESQAEGGPGAAVFCHIFHPAQMPHAFSSHFFCRCPFQTCAFMATATQQERTSPRTVCRCSSRSIPPSRIFPAAWRPISAQGGSPTSTSWAHSRNRLSFMKATSRR